MSIDHYENFPVAGILCPPALRPAIIAVYRFARTADDLADEGDTEPAERLDALAAYRRDLCAAATGGSPSGRWPTVFEPLGRVLAAHALPLPLLADLLSAFEQDVVTQRYASRADLLDYCRRSAEPVGRLVLHLHGITDPESLRRSDAVCSALQLINFWQDLSVDTRRGRLYIPLEDCVRAGVDPAQLLAGVDSSAARRLVGDMVAWAGETMLRGAPLVHNVAGRVGWELRLVVQGGLRILDKITALDNATLRNRPTLTGFDTPLMLWRALRMRPATPPPARFAA